MAALRRWFSRLVNVLRPGRAEDELSREIAAHLALIEDEHRRQGLPADQARRAARLALGGVEQAKDRHRDARSFAWLDDARRDAAYAVRLLRRNPVLAATAALSLAIGIGANTAIFSVANALLFRAPAGVAEPDRLVDIGTGRLDGGFNPSSYPNFLDIRRRATTLDGVYAHNMFPAAMNLGFEGTAAGPERVFGHFVSINYFAALGVRPAAGRLFGAADSEQPGASPIAVLSHRFWTRRFNRDPAVVGRTLRFNGYPFTVAGVAPEGFQGTGVVVTDAWLPLTMASAMQPGRGAFYVERGSASVLVGGRLKAGVSVEAAAAEIQAIGRALQREYPAEMHDRELRLLPSSTVPGNGGLVAGFVVLLMGIVSVVLLVACANVSGILLARAAARRREIAVRLAIGAGRARLIRQLLMETLVLFVVGGAAGVALARGMTSLIVSGLPALPFPVSASLALDGRVMAFTAGLSLVAALLSGLTPALQGSKADPVAALKDDSQGPSGRSRLRHAFVVAQVACSVLLVITAGLFVRALVRAGSIDPGFEARGVEIASIDLSTAGYTNATAPRFSRELVERVRRLPGVGAATIASVAPGGFEGLGIDGFSVPGAPADWAQFFEPDWNLVEPGYFATLRIPLVAGRDFTADDGAGTQPVVIVGEAAARYFWPGQSAVGRYMLQRTDAKTGATQTVLVVGVARDIKSSSLIDGLSASFIYLPLQQQSAVGVGTRMTIVARATGGRRVGESIRTLVASMNPNLPIVASQTLEDSVALGLVPQRVAASVSASLGLVGLLLAAIGIYGVTAFTVTRRTREFGVRIALGAGRGDIVWMVLRQGMSLTAIGWVIGLGLGVGVGQFITVFLFGLPSFDPVTFLGATILIVAIALAACCGPARRATSVDPLIALRGE